MDPEEISNSSKKSARSADIPYIGVLNNPYPAMSIFNDLKRVFFGAKSVAKHQGGKAADALRDAGENLADEGKDLLDDTKTAAKELVDRAPEYYQKGKDALEDLTDKIWEDADAAVDKAKSMKDKASDAINSKLEELNPKPKPTAGEPFLDEEFELDLVEEADAPKSGSVDFEEPGLIESARTKAGEVLSDLDEKASPTLDAAARAGLAARDKIASVSETVGKEVMEKGDDLLNRAAEAGASAKDKFDDFVDHANVEAEKMRMEDAIEDAKTAAAQAEARARAFGDSEAARDTSESTLEGTGSFFDRAAKFAEGDYHNDPTRASVVPGEPTPEEKPKGGKIAGFLDGDGDGDSLIDDAEIIE